MKGKMNNEIKEYQKVQQMKNVLKQVQQLSWNITQFDRKFPFEAIQAGQYGEYKFMYESFVSDLRKIFDEVLALEEKKLNE